MVMIDVSIVFILLSPSLLFYKNKCVCVLVLSQAKPKTSGISYFSFY